MIRNNHVFFSDPKQRKLGFVSHFCIGDLKRGERICNRGWLREREESRTLSTQQTMYVQKSHNVPQYLTCLRTVEPLRTLHCWVQMAPMKSSHVSRVRFIESEKFTSNQENIEVYLHVFSIGTECFASNDLGPSR